MPALAEPAWRIKTRPCPFYQQGRCLFASNCNFLHDTSLQSPNPIPQFLYTGPDITPPRTPPRTPDLEKPSLEKSPILRALRDAPEAYHVLGSPIDLLPKKSRHAGILGTATPVSPPKSPESEHSDESLLPPSPLTLSPQPDPADSIIPNNILSAGTPKSTQEVSFADPAQLLSFSLPPFDEFVNSSVLFNRSARSGQVAERDVQIHPDESMSFQDIVTSTPTRRKSQLRPLRLPALRAATGFPVLPETPTARPSTFLNAGIEEVGLMELPMSPPSPADSPTEEAVTHPQATMINHPIYPSPSPERPISLPRSGGRKSEGPDTSARRNFMLALDEMESTHTFPPRISSLRHSLAAIASNEASIRDIREEPSAFGDDPQDTRNYPQDTVNYPQDTGDYPLDAGDDSLDVRDDSQRELTVITDNFSVLASPDPRESIGRIFSTSSSPSSPLSSGDEEDGDDSDHPSNAYSSDSVDDCIVITPTSITPIEASPTTSTATESTTNTDDTLMASHIPHLSNTPQTDININDDDSNHDSQLTDFDIQSPSPTTDIFANIDPIVNSPKDLYTPPDPPTQSIESTRSNQDDTIRIDSAFPSPAPTPTPSPAEKPFRNSFLPYRTSSSPSPSSSSSRRIIIRPDQSHRKSQSIPHPFRESIIRSPSNQQHPSSAPLTRRPPLRNAVRAPTSASASQRTRDSSPSSSAPSVAASIISIPHLFFALASDSPASVSHLLRSGVASANDKAGPDDLPALVFTLANEGLANKTEIVKELLGHGADPSVVEHLVPRRENDKGKTWGGEIALNEDGEEDDEEEDSPLGAKIRAAMNPAVRYYLNRGATATVPQRQVEALQSGQYSPLLRARFCLVGQDLALEEMVRAVASHSRRKTEKGSLSLVLAGPSGHGKSYLASKIGSLLAVPIYIVNMTNLRTHEDLFNAKSLAAESDDSENVLQFLERHEGSRCVIILEEIEKTAEKLALHTLLMPWELGKLATPKVIDTSKVIWVCTSNAGEELVFDFHHTKETGVSSTREEYGKLMTLMRGRLADELGASIVSRVNAVLPFLPFTVEEQRALASEALSEVVATEQEQPEWLTPSASDKLVDQAVASYIEREGARSIHRAVQSLYEDQDMW